MIASQQNNVYTASNLPEMYLNARKHELSDLAEYDHR